MFTLKLTASLPPEKKPSAPKRKFHLNQPSITRHIHPGKQTISPLKIGHPRRNRSYSKHPFSRGFQLAGKPAGLGLEVAPTPATCRYALVFGQHVVGYRWRMIAGCFNSCILHVMIVSNYVTSEYEYVD